MLMSRRNCMSLVVMVFVSLASAGVVVSGVLTAPAGPEVAVECGVCKGSGTGNQACTICEGTGVKNGRKCTECKGKGFDPCYNCGGTGKVNL